MTRRNEMQKYFTADTKSALVTDWFEIFIRIVHNVRFWRIVDWMILTFVFLFRTLYVANFTHLQLHTSHFILPPYDLSYNLIIVS